MTNYTIEDLKELLRHNPHYIVSSKAERCIKGKIPLSEFDRAVRDSIRRMVASTIKSYGYGDKLRLDYTSIFKIMFLVRFEYLPCYMDSAFLKPYVQCRLVLGK